MTDTVEHVGLLQFFFSYLVPAVPLWLVSFSFGLLWDFILRKARLLAGVLFLRFERTDRNADAVLCFLSAAEPGGLRGLRQSPQPGVPEVGEERVRVHVNGCR